MRQLGNSRREQYAQLRARGFPPTKAATSAGYSPNSSISTTLDRDPAVIARVEQLSCEHAKVRASRAEALRSVEASEINSVWVMQELVRVVADCREDRDYRNANAALKLIGEQIGMWSKSADLSSSGRTSTAPSPILSFLAAVNFEDLDPTPPPPPAPDAQTIATLTGRSTTAVET